MRSHSPAIAIGTPTGWDAFVDRIRELLASEADEDATHKAVYWPLGGVTRPEYDEQLELRRRALRDVRLSQRATPADEVIQQMAGLLVELVKLTPTGLEALAEQEPDSALRLLAEANDHVEPIVQRNESSKSRRRPAHAKASTSSNVSVPTNCSAGGLMAELFEWAVVVDGHEIEVLAERRRVGDVIYLDDIAVYPASGTSVTVGAAAVLRVARRELPKQFRGSGASSLVIRGSRLTGANPGRTVEITIALTEEETNEHDS